MNSRKKRSSRSLTEAIQLAKLLSDLATTTHSLYLWLKKYGDPSPRQADKADLTVENAHLKADLKRMTEERDILKKPQSTLPTSPGKVLLHL